VDTRFQSVFRIFLSGCLLAFILLIMLSSCENDVETVNLVSAPDTLAVETIYELTANWGISWEKRKVMEAKNNVVVINHETQEQLDTEHLVWNQNDKLIYSEVFVKITTPDKTIYGENGMEADEEFNSWKLKKVKGDIIVDKDEY